MKPMKTFILLFCLVEITFSTVSMPNLFTNSMVLQRDQTIKIWGNASNGEVVTVNFNGQTKSATTQNGSWSIKLDPMKAAGPLDMTVKGNNTITIKDIYIGEVWQCAGQSNMDTRVGYYPHYNDIMNNTNLPNLRYLTIRQPGGVTNTVWEKCTSPEKISMLSCLGFFFGKEILEKLDTVAVGLIVTAVGGTTFASWIDPLTIQSNPDIVSIDGDAATMYNTWVKPVEGCAMRGVLWMQGENDRFNGLYQYHEDFLSKLIKGWRDIWKIGDFPFYIMQLANYGTVQTDPNESASSAVIREAQRLGLNEPNTELVVIIDIGDSLHFGNKQEAGRRFALAARAKEYGDDDLVYSGPLFIEKFIEESKIHCRFIHVGSGLKTKSGDLRGFAVAGPDNKFVWADAQIHNDTVTVFSSSVSNPVNVRYSYGANPFGNLVNEEGLPASPFTTEGNQLNFKTHSLITLIESGEGSISPESGNFSTNSVVTITAAAQNGYLFDHWEGDLLGDENPATITMDSDKSISAFFIPDNTTYYSVKAISMGNGTVTMNPADTILAEKTKVHITAYPSTGWFFDRWTGDFTGTDSTLVISSLDKNYSLIARFMPVNINVYEAEYAVMKSAIAESTNTGFSGTGYANVDNKTGSSIEIPVYISENGEKEVKITYANGSTSARTFIIGVNETEIVSKSFAVTGNWTNWDTLTVILSFNEGINTVIFTSSEEDGGPNIDKIEILQSAGKSSIKPLSNHSALELFYRDNKLVIKTENQSLSLVEIYSLKGQKIFSKKIQNEKKKLTSVIPVEFLCNGIYVAKTFSGTQSPGYLIFAKH